MIYTILALGDIHFGAMDADTTFAHLYPVIDCLYKSAGKIDMIVINGDYYDYKLQLNSKAALRGLEWFDILVNAAKETGVQKIRIVKGTKDHDYDQLEAFRSYEKDSDFVRIYNENTFEEVLPEFSCIFCPDETINEDEYMKLYLPNIMQIADMGFFHGSFDLVLPGIVLQRAEEISINNIIFRYAKWASFIRGPLIASHWHEPHDEYSLHYIGSYDRWKFGEPGTKGFAIIRYDTDTHKYAYTKITNPFAIEYETFSLTTGFFNTYQDYLEFAETIFDYMKHHPSAKIRIDIKITDERLETDSYIKALEQKFLNHSRRIKFNITNMLTKKKKIETKTSHEEIYTKFKFLFESPLDLCDNIQKFLFEKHNISMSIDDIATIVDRYIEK